MNHATKRIFAIVLATGLCFHFLMILIYGSPLKISSKKLNIISHLYVYPIFHQNWALFVPAPAVERKLFVRYKSNTGYSNWEDILGREIMLHKENRLSGGENKVLLLSNSLIYELNYLYSKNSFATHKKPTNKEFRILQFEVDHYLKSHFNCKDKDIYELLLVSAESNKINAYYIQSLTIN